MVRLDEQVYRPGRIVGIQESGVTIRIDSCPGDTLTRAVREDTEGRFHRGTSGENLWCSQAPRGAAIGAWEVL